MQSFELTEDHIKLLRHAYVSWNNCEFGAPEINPKRPYGNSDVIPDLAHILEIDPDCDENRQYLDQIHTETKQALQIILATGRFETGLYVREDYSRNWMRVVPND